MDCNRQTLSGICAAIAGITALILQSQLEPAAAQAPSAPPAAASSANSGSEPDKVAIDRIVECLNDGREAVLLSDGVECKKYGEGDKFLKEKDPGMPLKLDAAKVCDGIADKDLRKLSSTAIKKIAARRKAPYDSLGIRIFGAIFCEQLDLVGLNLEFSLVIDRSFFRGGLEARNFRTRGDLSFDRSAAYGTVRVARSRVDGTIWGSDAYIKKLLILDSEVHGSLIFRRTELPEPAVFDTIALSGELSVRGSTLSYFFLQFSKVGGVLDLTGSRARCAYLIRTSEIGDLVAVDAGFGRSEPGNLFDWPRTVDRFGNASQASKCEFGKIALPGAFRVSDTRVRSSLCFRSFYWLAPRSGGQPESFVTFTDLNVGATSFIDLASPVIGGVAQKREGKHNFEAIGLATHSFIFNFGTRDQLDEMSVSGLGFEQVYAAEVQCAYDPNYYEPPVGGNQSTRLENVSDPRSKLRLPRVNEVMSWLGSNCLQTTQPFAAFVDAAQKSGNDTDAKQFRIARANKELWLRINRAFGTGATSSCSGAFQAKVGEDPSMTDRISKFVTFLNDVLAIGFGIILWAVAQHGYRPEQAGFFVIGALMCAAIYLWLWIRVVGFMPANKDTVRPIGAMFLFDRLLPAYLMREEHSAIESFYVRPKKGGSGRSDATIMKYLWFRIPVVRAGTDDVHRAERCFDVIKAVGFVLIIFLVAAINALFSH
jgi:hypothetical protein